MSGSAILFMIGICTFIWGGFVTLLVKAIRSEGRKTEG